MKITTYHDHDVGSFLLAGALACLPLSLSAADGGADVLMQSKIHVENS
jgi:hypothetical protein